MAKNEEAVKMVTVRLYMGDLPQTRQPVDVWINGQKFTVPRGTDVEIPEFVAAALKDAEDAKMEGDAFNETRQMVQY